MKLSDFENEKALELLANIMDPIIEICKDGKVVDTIRSGNKIGAVKVLLNDHKKPLIEILAALNGQKVEEYHANILDITAQIMTMLNDETIMQVFSLQSQTPTFSGSATESTEETEEA